MSSDSETISWKNRDAAGFRVPASIIPNYSGARKPDPTTLSRAVLPKPAVIFSVVVVVLVVLVVVVVRDMTTFQTRELL